MRVKFIETTVFTARIREIMPDDEYFRLQDLLIQRPDVGVVIIGSGGIRKVRVRTFGRGKRGGARVIYFWAASEDTILMLDVYAKSEREDITAAQLKQMKRIVEEAFYE